MRKTTHLHSHSLAAVSYIPLVNLIVLWGHRSDHFVVFHTLQGLLLSVYFLLSYFLIPKFGAYVALIFAALAASGFIQAATGKIYHIPLISDFVEWLAKIFDKQKKPH